MKIDATKIVVVTVGYETVKEFRRQWPGFTITAIDDRKVLGFCEGCGRVLYEVCGLCFCKERDSAAAKAAGGE